MSKKSYSDKLLDPRWQKKRLEILQRDDFCCQMCFDSENTLAVHHRYYWPNYEPWEYDNDAYVTLCRSCHDSETESMPKSCDRLIHALKRAGFTAYNIQFLADAMDGFKMQHISDVVTEVYAESLVSPEVQAELIEKYFEGLMKKKELKDA